jgi:hypothetical protein
MTALLGVAGCGGVTGRVARTPSPPRRSSAASQPACGVSLAPGAPPPWRVRPVRVVSNNDGGRVLARTPSGARATLRAAVGIRQGLRATFSDGVLIIASPGTSPGVGGGRSPESLYRGEVRARGPLLSLTAPSNGVLTVTSPPTLAPGRYPVIWAADETRLGSRFACRRLGGPYTVSARLGLLVIKAANAPAPRQLPPVPSALVSELNLHRGSLPIRLLGPHAKARVSERDAVAVSYRSSPGLGTITSASLATMGLPGSLDRPSTVWLLGIARPKGEVGSGGPCCSPAPQHAVNFAADVVNAVTGTWVESSSGYDPRFGTR